jgi:hypothetical protein
VTRGGVTTTGIGGNNFMTAEATSEAFDEASTKKQFRAIAITLLLLRAAPAAETRESNWS